MGFGRRPKIQSALLITSHHVTWGLHAIDWTCLCDACGPGSSGWVTFVRRLHRSGPLSPPFPFRSSPGEGESVSPPWAWRIYMNNLGFFSTGDLPPLHYYLFNHRFISVWTHGYLFSTLGYNPILLFCFKFSSFSYWKLFRLDPHSITVGFAGTSSLPVTTDSLGSPSCSNPRISCQGALVPHIGGNNRIQDLGIKCTIRSILKPSKFQVNS